MEDEKIRKQLLQHTDEIVQNISKGNAIEIKKSKEELLIFEINRKKIK